MSDTPETDAENDLQCELAAWELLAEARRECVEVRNKMADALQEVDLRTLDFERMKQERDEAQEYSKATWQSLRDSQDEVLRLTFENRELTQGIDEALILGNKLADECERILGLGLHQNTTERFKAALEAWKNYNNE